jgi:uncharacterized protein involved in response to NO
MAIPRYRPYSGPAILLQGFRPFFFLAGLWAAVALCLSIEMILGRVALPTAFDAISWHYHEMLFGYVAAAIGGFLLTAIPNWTGRLPLQGGALAALVGLWLAGRVGVATSAVIGVWPAALIDLSFLAGLIAVCLREILAGRNWRNLPIIALLSVFLVTNGFMHAALIGLIGDDAPARRLAIGVVIALIALIGGRIIPSFTRNWLVKKGAKHLPASFGRFDRAALIATVAALLTWVAAPEWIGTGALMAVAAVLTLIRLARWRGWAAWSEPLLWVLHLGHLWVAIGFGLLALSVFDPSVPQTGALHALTAGAVGTMTLAVMSRATMGHTGRELRAGPGLAAAFVLVSVAAAARIVSPVLPGIFVLLLLVAAVAWVGAFALYLVVCCPMWWTRRKEAGLATPSSPAAS